MLSEVISSTLGNLVLLVVTPFGCYFVYHKRRHQRGFSEIVQRAGLKRGNTRYLGYCLVPAAAIVAFLVLRPLPLEPMIREGSSWRQFSGLGLGGTSVLMALLYGVIQTGFAEEFLFRGMIAGSLSRRLPQHRANIVQASIFLAPHLLLLRFAPEMWGVLVVVFAGALFGGWVRIKSDSMLGPWLIHAAVNVTMGLSVAIRSAG